MASFSVIGFDDIEKALLKREKAAVEAAPRMLKAGADVLVKAQRAAIERLKLVDTGDMRDSIKPTPVRNSDTGSTIEVYPQGKDRKGVRNAEKAFIAEYGRSNQPARPWMSSANAQCAEEVHQAMREEWEAVRGE